MKKLGLIVVAASSLLAACGNETILDGKYYPTDIKTGDGTLCVIDNESVRKDRFIFEINSEGDGDDKLYFFTPNKNLGAPIPSTEGAKIANGVVDMVSSGPYRNNAVTTTVQIEINDDVENTLWLNKFDMRAMSRKGLKEINLVERLLFDSESATRVCLIKKANS
jgi:hypothetical protein